jgi:OmpA-OmpF porin, OOP family
LFSIHITIKKLKIMKNAITILTFLLITLNSHAQTRTLRTNLSFGGGFENFNGDMGNTYFEPGEEVYGFFHFALNRYINPSFDVSLSATKGDLGRCLEPEDVIKYNSHFMMRARMTSAFLTLKYKLNNGYFLKENAKLAPYFSLGIGMNELKDIWAENTRVNKGNYSSINAGFGVKYNFTERYSLGYHLGFGRFNSDEIDFRKQGGNDQYMQNTFVFGVNLR